MEKTEEKGDPVLLDCRSNVFYNNEHFDSIPYMGNNNRSAPVFEANNDLSDNRGENGILGNEISYNRFPGSQWNVLESNSRDEEELTVSVQNVSKAYEEGKPVLSNLSMNVRKGTIYGLLGSSGCGKTTLLSCIVGLKSCDSGRILLFNKKPTGAFPGRRVGYMPQELALCNELSVREMIGYYGRLYGMAETEIQKQWVWLTEFLQLPAKFKLIKDLSGGQKRRVSLAITLVHSGHSGHSGHSADLLLLLDEPTVGLDPLLRESIWKHLFNMVETQKTTVIVTTHYIEEARFSNTIGVMRKGRLLVEDSPQALLQLYQCNLLEEVVLKLCRKDNEGMGSEASSNNNVPTAVVVSSKGEGKTSKGKIKFSSKHKHSYNVQDKMVQIQEGWKTDYSPRSSSSSVSSNELNEEGSTDGSSIFDRVWAMSTVIWLVFFRHPAFMIMVLFLPTLQMILTLAVIGQHPKNLKFGVINNDMPMADSCFRNDYTLDGIYNDLNGTSMAKPASCDFQHLSCNLITELSKSGSLTLVPMQSVDEAIAQIDKGDLWGYYSFPSNYSQNLQDFATAHKFAENETLEGSRVRLRMDMSNYLGAAFAIRDSFQAYESFAVNMAKSCGMNPKEVSLPLHYRKPVFGKNEGSYQDYVIPIVILTVVFEIPMLVTSILFINDRKQGTLDRARVAGLHFKEVMITHFLTQGSVIIGQAGICSVVLYLFYDFHVEGWYWLYFFNLILGGICGESLGLLLGVVFEQEVEALMFGIFIGPILLMYEGVVWPVDCMRPAIRTIAYLSPTTLNVEALRSIVYRGVGFFHGNVWPGILMMTAWIIAFWLVSITLFIRKQK